ncbi:hypothetical protein L345_12247, partial [Ophiophagus hannah]
MSQAGRGSKPEWYACPLRTRNWRSDLLLSPVFVFGIEAGLSPCQVTQKQSVSTVNSQLPSSKHHSNHSLPKKRKRK